MEFRVSDSDRDEFQGAEDIGQRREKWLSLGMMLKNMRDEQGLTLEKLSLLTGVPMSWISRLERGMLSDPKFSMLVRVGKVLGISPNKLANFIGEWQQVTPVEMSPFLTKVQELYNEVPDNKKPEVESLVLKLLEFAK